MVKNLPCRFCSFPNGSPQDVTRHFDGICTIELKRIVIIIHLFCDKTSLKCYLYPKNTIYDNSVQGILIIMTMD
ncbi:MAG TPA: hypothetical protein DCX23_05720, partial [Lachnospiraceae bacterium]|nr:hypothetical protein [Lachnospiraceae bacterium]